MVTGSGSGSGPVLRLILERRRPRYRSIDLAGEVARSVEPGNQSWTQSTLSSAGSVHEKHELHKTRPTHTESSVPLSSPLIPICRHKLLTNFLNPLQSVTKKPHLVVAEEHIASPTARRPNQSIAKIERF